MEKLVTGRSYSEFQFVGRSAESWMDRLFGNAAPIVLDIVVLLILAGVALFFMSRLRRLHRMVPKRGRR